MKRPIGAVADGLLGLQRRLLSASSQLPRFILAKGLVDKSAAHTLDASCGSGTFTLWMAQQGMRVTGVDFSEHEIQMAAGRSRDLGLDIAFRVCDLADAPELPDAAFDQIVSLDTIVHIPDDDAVFDTFARVLKPGGHVIASLAAFGPSGSGRLYPLQKTLRRWIPRTLDGPAVYSRKPWLRATPEDLQNAMSQHRYYHVDELRRRLVDRFSLVHFRYGLHLFTAVATDLVFGIRYGRYLEPLAFYAAAQADRLFCSPTRPGYLLWVVLRRNL